MKPDLTLYYAPDNASLCVRLALLALDLPFETRLVDRAVKAQKDPAYTALNPNGLIPTLDTAHGPIYETGAILLWLADQNPGQLFPPVEAPSRLSALAWLFWLSNTLHPALRMTFYPNKYIDADNCSALVTTTRQSLIGHFTHLENHADWIDDGKISILHCYLAPMIRWSALYGSDQSWFDLSQFVRLHAFVKKFEVSAIAHQATLAEGLGPTIFSAPVPPNPPEGSAV